MAERQGLVAHACNSSTQGQREDTDLEARIGNIVRTETHLDRCEAPGLLMSVGKQ